MAEALEAERLLAALATQKATPPVAKPDEDTPQVAAITVYGGPSETQRVRAVIQLKGDVPFKRRERPVSSREGRAVVFAFEGTELGPDVQELTEVNRAGLRRIVLDREGDDLRATIELTADAIYELFVMDERIVLDVQAGSEADRKGQPLVVLDPGHGGKDRGSPGQFGLWEGELTLDISRRVRAWLKQLAPQLRVRMTRDSDVYLTLEERAAMANALNANLFVSVHLNAANTTVDHGGVATYVLDVNNDRNVLRLAARENGTGTGDVSPLQFLVGSLARNEQRAESEKLATFVQRGTLVSARRYLPKLADRGVKSAMFYVLVGAQMPAVLVEASFITQPDEAAALATPAYRDALAEGIARGIAKYLADS